MNLRAIGFIAGAALLPAGASQAATFLDAGAAPADIADTVGAFKDALGTQNGNLPQNFVGGFRDVNWDGVPDEGFSDPDLFPGDFFNGSTPGRARGIEFAPTGESTGLQVSANAGNIAGVPIQFGDADEYTPFSEQKLFQTVGGSTLDVFFFNPFDQVTQARTLGFGAIFTGLAVADAPTITFYGPGGSILEELTFGIPVDEGLVFIGATFDTAVLERVAINTGAEAVMDDFIFGEPAPIPLPAAAWLLGGALVGLAAMRRKAA